ncbi:MAG: hypothetical protein GY901_11415 [Actinomycetia bacterium]|nr:hypothetical protein [Actinomycetes bacterium]
MYSPTTTASKQEQKLPSSRFTLLNGGDPSWVCESLRVAARIAGQDQAARAVCLEPIGRRLQITAIGPAVAYRDTLPFRMHGRSGTLRIFIKLADVRHLADVLERWRGGGDASLRLEDSEQGAQLVAEVGSKKLRIAAKGSDGLWLADSADRAFRSGSGSFTGIRFTPDVLAAWTSLHRLDTLVGGPEDGGLKLETPLSGDGPFRLTVGSAQLVTAARRGAVLGFRADAHGDIDQVRAAA